MTFLQSFLLGCLQGLTEFIPVSSSGHLVILEHFFQLSLPSETLMAFDIILHSGTLCALFLYFWKDWWKMLVTLPREKFQSLLVTIAVATLPAAVVGVLIKDYIEVYMRSLFSVASMMIIVGFLFIFVEYVAKKYQSSKSITFHKALFIGFVQIFALIPGISRSGTTISAGLLVRMSREQAARFSFLLGTPLILGATLYIALQSMTSGIQFPSFSILVTGFFSSAIMSFLCIHFLLRFLKKHALSWFSIYLFLLAILIFYLI